MKSCARRQLFRSVSEALSSSTAYTRSPESSEPPPAVQGGVLSVSVQSFCGSVVIPEHVLEAIWKKAADLTKEQAAILQAPGGTGFLVKSNSNPRPHFITVKRSGQYCCDSECPNWKSLCMCAHSVAVAEKEGDLERFIEWFKQAKKAPNLTKLVTTKMPKGRGHKGGVAPSKKKRKVTSAERIPFTAVCGMSNSQNSASTSPLNPEESTSHVNQPQSSNVPMEGHLSHTLTTSSGSRSQAVASDFYISHHVSLPSGRAASQGYVSEGCSMPSVPPPLISCGSASPADDSPFVLLFLSGNIRICRGCKQNFQKPPTPPYDLCIRHQEWQEFTPAGSTLRYGNVYYHCNVPCILSRCVNFAPSMLVIPANVLVQLLPVHTSFLHSHMPGRLS